MNEDKCVKTTIKNRSILTWYFSAYYYIVSFVYTTIMASYTNSQDHATLLQQTNQTPIFGSKANLCVLLLRPTSTPYSAADVQQK